MGNGNASVVFCTAAIRVRCGGWSVVNAHLKPTQTLTKRKYKPTLMKHQSVPESRFGHAQGKDLARARDVCFDGFRAVGCPPTASMSQDPVPLFSMDCFAVLRRGKLGTGEFWNGTIWHNKTVPNYATVFEGPKPFF